MKPYPVTLLALKRCCRAALCKFRPHTDRAHVLHKGIYALDDSNVALEDPSEIQVALEEPSAGSNH
jgi:hypothetical protein